MDTVATFLGDQSTGNGEGTIHLLVMPVELLQDTCQMQIPEGFERFIVLRARFVEGRRRKNSRDALAALRKNYLAA
jgi:hypothetical protein